MEIIQKKSFFPSLRAMPRKRLYRRDSRASTLDLSEISEKSDTSLWNRSVSRANEERVRPKGRLRGHTSGQNPSNRIS